MKKIVIMFMAAALFVASANAQDCKKKCDKAKTECCAKDEKKCEKSGDKCCEKKDAKCCDKADAKCAKADAKCCKGEKKCAKKTDANTGASTQNRK
ncbi:MAG: hypothetical protein J5676_00440 [Bacteroidaceae bacterium]|nr:hypothetical protein [Bacteroidaceae bacterium]